MLSWANASASRTSAGIGVEGGRHLGWRHPQVVDPDPVEPLGQVPQGGVAVLPDLGQHGPHLVHGRFGLGRGTGKPPAQVVGAGPPQVESAEHGRQRYRRTPCGPAPVPPWRGPADRVETGPMETDRAELSALATSIDELTRRVTAAADRLRGTPGTTSRTGSTRSSARC